MNKINKLFIAVLAGTSMLTSCGSDFLDVDPNTYTSETYYTSDDALTKGVETLYNKAWFDFNRSAFIAMGSFRANDGWNPYVSGDLGYFRVNSSNEDVASAWSSLYTVVSQSDQIIDNITNYCGDEVSESAKNAALGECHLMRGWAYFYLLRGWGDALIFEHVDETAKQPVVPLYNEASVLEYVVRDFEAADSLLPENGSNYHPSRYAAKAALAKALLAQSGWVENSTTDHSRNEQKLKRVVELCNQVIASGRYSLANDYASLFSSTSNDNSETILALRWSDPVTGVWGTTNAFYSSLAFPAVSQDPNGNSTNSISTWGGITASADMLDLYNEDVADTIRRNATFFMPNHHYNDLWKTYGGYTFTQNAPYVKKGVLGLKSDVSPLNISNQASPLNTYIQRYADVFLMKAEAILGNKASTSDAEALSAINTIRSRANVAALSSITFEDIIKERRKEFSMEGSNWWDMVTWYRWKPATMLKYFNDVQFRGAYITDQTDGNENNLGSYVLNEDGTISYVVDPPTGSWHSYNWGYSCEEFGESTGYAKFWNDHVSIHSWSWPGDSVQCLTVVNGKKYNYRKLMSQYVDFTPIVLDESNIFFPYPATDAIQNHYLVDNNPIDYEFK